MIKSIHNAAFYGDLGAIKRFIEENGVEVDQRDSGENTALIETLFSFDKHPNECLPIVEYLIEKGADVNAKSSCGWTALLLAKTLPIAKILVEHGAKIEDTLSNGKTPLIEHSFMGDTDVVKYLLSLGANVKAKDENGDTALHLANNVEISKALVEHGADIDAIDNEGMTPLIYSARWGGLKKEIIAYLESVGANKSIKDKDGKTARDACCEWYHAPDKMLIRMWLRDILKP